MGVGSRQRQTPHGLYTDHERPKQLSAGTVAYNGDWAALGSINSAQPERNNYEGAEKKNGKPDGIHLRDTREKI